MYWSILSSGYPVKIKFIVLNTYKWKDIECNCEWILLSKKKDFKNVKKQNIQSEYNSVKLKLRIKYRLASRWDLDDKEGRAKVFRSMGL